MNGPSVVAARILHSPDLRRVFGAFFLFNAAEFATWIAILLYAYARTGPQSVGVVALIQLIPAALVAAPVAGLGDRYPRASVLLGGYLAQAIAMALTAVTMVLESPVAVVYLAAAFAATAMVVPRPTQSSLLPSLARTPEELTASNGAAGVVEGAGVLVGPLLAALILTSGSPATVFGWGAVASGLAALLVVGIRPRTGPGALAALQPVAVVSTEGFLSGLRVLLADPDARVVVGLLSMRMLIIGAADVLFVLLALEVLGMGTPGPAILNAALGAGAIVGGLITLGFVGRSRLALVAAAGAIAWGACFSAATLLGSATAATFLIVAGGAGLAIVDVASRTILQRSVRDEVLSRVFGLQEGLAMTALAAGALLVPILIALMGLTGAALVCAALMPVVVALSWTRLTALDRRTVVPTRAIALLRTARVFAGLPGPPLESVARRAVWQVVQAETAIIRQGDAGDRYYVIASGRVRVEQDGRFLRELAVVGDGFGEIALLRSVPRTATVTAVEETELLAIDRRTFLDAVTGHSGASAEAYEVMAARP